jgi:uncharacterized protein (DUF433 family)
MRIRVKDILDLLASGSSRDEILADFPYLEAEDIVAARSDAPNAVWFNGPAPRPRPLR